MTCRLNSKRCLILVSCAVLLAACLGNSVRAQGVEQDWEKAAGGKQQFDVASVREDKLGKQYSNFLLDGSGSVWFVVNRDDKTAPGGSLFSAMDQTLMRYITFAYKLSATEEVALRTADLNFWAGLGMHVPAWVNHTGFDIQARAPGAATTDQMRLMMQSLLAERFKLAVHKETRQAPVFAMVLDTPGTLGPQLRAHPASDTCATTVFPQAPGAEAEKSGVQKSAAATDRSQTLPIPCGMIARLPPTEPGRHRIGGRDVTLAMVAESLPAQTGLAVLPRPVIDRTGLSGAFDFSLEWSQAVAGDMAVGPNAQGEAAGPSIAKALKQQLGVKLESTRGPVELLVIDHVEKPTAN